MEIINYLKRVNGSEHIVEHVGWHESGDYLLRLLFSDGNPFRQHKYDVEKEYAVIDKSEVEKLERQSCGRRMQDFGPQSRKEGIDHWKIMKNGDRVCSYCGSLHPDDVLAKVKQYGLGVIGNTTKSYKWYVGINSAINLPGYQDGGFKYYRHHDTDEFITEMNNVINSQQSVN